MYKVILILNKDLGHRKESEESESEREKLLSLKINKGCLKT